jgi:Icc protein
MPIHLPPLSRRKFLSRALAAGAGLALEPYLFAKGKPTDHQSWALLSDLHLAANRLQLGRGINMADHFAEVTQEVLALPKRPAGVFITGDCAFNSGEKGDYATLTEMLDPIRKDAMPVHLALGNHDHREHFWEALSDQKAARRPLKDRQVALIKTKQANWFVLDSLEKTLATPGLLGPEQLKWLAKGLDANAKKPALILVHHNPGLSGNMGLKDTALLFEVIRPRKHVKAYIFGHTHKWSAQQDDSGIHLINLPPVAYIFKDGDPAGWVHAIIEREGMKLELRCLDKAHASHGQIVNCQWRA